MEISVTIHWFPFVPSPASLVLSISTTILFFVLSRVLLDDKEGRRPLEDPSGVIRVLVVVGEGRPGRG